MTDALQRAERAKALLDDPLIIEAMTSIEDALFTGWKASAADDEKGRERLFHVLCAMQAFRSFFGKVVQDGQVYAHNVQLLKRGQF